MSGRMAEHQWTEEGKDRLRTCRNEGCAVRLRRRGFAHEEWQAAKGHHWHPIPKAGAHCAVPIPPCKGVALHEWRDEANGLSVCQSEGCALLFDRILGAWKRPAGLKWQRIKEHPLPLCRGAGATPPDGLARCTHVDRFPLALGPGQTVRGGLKVGQCERPALPRLVVCEQHAEPEAIRLLVLAMAAEIERLARPSSSEVAP